MIFRNKINEHFFFLKQGT